jgi:hypothetical protein
MPQQDNYIFQDNQVNADKKNIPNRKITINTLQRAVYLARICERRALYHDVISFDDDNLYPQKTEVVGQRSVSIQSTKRLFRDFVMGQFIEGFDDLVINRKGWTGRKLREYISDGMHSNNNISLQFLPNRLGQIAEIYPATFKFLRFKADGKKIVWNPYWDRGISQENRVEYDLFDPDLIKPQIKKEGFNLYKGQVLYANLEHSQRLYPLCGFDSVLDDAQLENEIGIFKISHYQNNLFLGGILFDPGGDPNNDDEESETETILKQKAQGASNTGAFIRIPVNLAALQDVRGFDFFKQFQYPDISKLTETDLLMSMRRIFMHYNQPPILSGASFGEGMFNQESFKDAGLYYSWKTQVDRDSVSEFLNDIFQHTIWANDIPDIDIKPLEMFSVESTQTNIQTYGSNSN